MSITFSKKGITLVEVVIAIIVFGTGVLVVLGMLTQNVTWIHDLNHKTTAVTLAKEGIDMVYHLRDSNLEKGTFWNCSEIDSDAPSYCGGYFLSGGAESAYLIDRDTEGLYYLTSYNDTGNSRIYYHTGTFVSSGSSFSGFWYNHTASGGERTLFKRYIVFKPMSEYPTNTGYVLQLESHVEFSRSGGAKKEVVLESIIGDIR